MPARLTPQEKRYIIKQLTLGSSYEHIVRQFPRRFKRTVTTRTIARFRINNQKLISNGKDLIAARATASAVTMKRKGYELLEVRLDDAIEDAGQIRKLREQLQSKEITPAQYKHEMELYERLTITELVKLTDAMHAQSKGDTDPEPTPQDEAALTALVAGIQAGNPVQLVQILKGRT